MAENTDKEHLDNPTNTQSENSFEESTLSTITDTINPNQETENMEVHKHPYHVTHKKKWGEYLLEFFMLFLAVFLGFVAENIREHNVEHQRAKVLAQSIFEDLKKDSAYLNTSIAYSNKKITVIDSLTALMHSPVN